MTGFKGEGRKSIEEELEESQFDQIPIVYKVIGSPGSGKTTRVVGNPDIEDHTSLVQQNLDEYPLEDQIIVTYTNAGVDEAADRLERILNTSRNAIDKQVTTIHSRCFKLLNLDREQTVQHWDKQKFCKNYDLSYGWDDDADDIMSADKQEGNAFFDIYGWLKSNCEPIENYKKCPQPWDGSADFEFLAERWEMWKDDRNKIDFSDMIQMVVEQGRTQLENLGWGELFPDDDMPTDELFEKARRDPSRDPDIIRGKGSFIDAKVMYVDEVQDLTPLMWNWYLLQKLVCEKVYVGGDDDQCLPPGETVEVGKPVESDGSGPTGLSSLDTIVNEARGHVIPDQYQPVETPIENVEVGDMVKTSLTQGEIGYREVTDVHEHDVINKRFRTFTTESGKELTVTDNHKMFCRVPSEHQEKQNGLHYVYIMRDIKDRWRVGRTETLRRRLNIERTGRCVIPLGACETKEEAAKQELLYSLNYGIPPITFTQRQGELLSSKENKEEIWDEAPHNIEQLAVDVGVDLEYPPLYKKATTRGRTESVNITIDKCSDSRGASMGHKLSVHTSNEEVISQLKDIDALNAQERSRGGWRFRKYSSDYKLLGGIAKEIKQKVGGDIITQFRPTDSRDKAIVTPACNIAEGMLIPVEKKGRIEWEVISSIEDEVRDETVYDLTVDDTHNYLVSSSPVSNTIYGWAGANPEFMLDEEGDFEVLDKTYRIPANVWEECDGVINQVDKRQDKDVSPHGDGGEVVKLKRPSKRRITEYCEEGSVYILFRARYMIDDFTETLHNAGIPYDNVSTFDTWDDDIVAIRDALAKMESKEGKITGDEVQTLKDYAPDKVVNGMSGYDQTERAMSNLTGVEPERVEEVFDFSGGVGRGGFSTDKYLSYSKDYEDGINYYQREAIKNNIRRNNEDMYPERVRIGTIHSAKGKEAETIILALDSTPTILDNMVEHTEGQPDKVISDAERRVYYVGMTRASERLVLAEGIMDPSQTIKLEHLLDGYKESDNWAQEQVSSSKRW